MSESENSLITLVNNVKSKLLYLYDIEHDEELIGSNIETLSDYLNSNLYVEYRIDSCYQYRSVCIVVAIHNPYICIDTATSSIIGYLNEKTEVSLPTEVCDEINEFFNRKYESGRYAL